MNILKKLLRVGYIHFGNLGNSKLENEMGTPQGSILSPLMANIYLHELDKWIAKTRSTDKYSTARKDSVSEEYKATKRARGTD